MPPCLRFDADFCRYFRRRFITIYGRGAAQARSAVITHQHDHQHARRDARVTSAHDEVVTRSARVRCHAARVRDD